MRNFLIAAAAAVLMSGALTAGEKSLMHCFAYTAIEGASQADWDAFYKASDELPKKMLIGPRSLPYHTRLIIGIFLGSSSDAL